MPSFTCASAAFSRTRANANLRNSFSVGDFSPVISRHVPADRTSSKPRRSNRLNAMQLSRAFFLTPEKTFRRKLIEMLIAVELEQKFSKEEIFEFYANRVDLGQRGSFTISGFAEAARSYFNKDLKDINLPEAALLAGLIQAPSYLSPYRHPERALERQIGRAHV